jgi:tetratricopeptide (TPR) repeat protein
VERRGWGATLCGVSSGSGEAAADPSSCCAEARRLAESGELEAAGELFQRVLDSGASAALRAHAALGLAVVRADAGDVNGARDADWVAIQTRDPEYAPRAAYHLALSHEHAGDREKAREAWLIAVDFGNPAYLAPACLALARFADEDGDAVAARRWLARVIETGEPAHAAVAAYDLGHRLLERGETARARDVLAAALRLVDRDADPRTYARLAVSLGISYLDQAIGAFGSVLDGPDGADAADPDATPLAVELLARTLPLRDRAAEATEVWRRGLDDERISASVRDRLRREFPEPETEGLWWEPYVEEAIRTGGLPALAGELFGALDHMYALAALQYVDEPLDLLGRIIGVPSEYDWGRGLHDSFAERLRQALGPDAPELPPTWPDPPP